MESFNTVIKSKLMNAGASLVGFADVRELPVDMVGSVRSAISIAVALDTSIVGELSDGPTECYYQEYNRVNGLLADLCETAVEDLNNRGNKAVAINPTVKTGDLDKKTLTASFTHKAAARLAGLGWIGKSALLITEQYGPAVRLATVLTDAEFEMVGSAIESRCGDCKRCVDSCPANAIVGRNWELGFKRERIYDAFACCDMASRLSENAGISSVICGICINVCPWTQKYLLREKLG